MFTAFIEIIDGWGYTIAIDNSGEIVEEYQAGDSLYDSQVFGTGDISKTQLKDMAIETAKDMLFERGENAPYNLEITEINIHEENKNE